MSHVSGVRLIEGFDNNQLLNVAFRQIVNTHTLEPEVYILLEERGLSSSLLELIERRLGYTSEAYDDALALFS